DCCNAVTTHVAEEALRLMLAVKQDKPLPKIEETTKLSPERARQLIGRYKFGEKVLDLEESDGRLWAWPGRGGFRMELRARGEDLIVDDRIGYGAKIEVKDGKLKIGKDEYAPVKTEKPEPPPSKWLGLIGEYGWDHNTLFILEKDGKLHALIEWFFLYPLTEESENVFAFPNDFALYHGEKLTFTRDPNGKATQVLAGPVLFKRRPLDGEDGSTFRIQ